MQQGDQEIILISLLHSLAFLPRATICHSTLARALG